MFMYVPVIQIRYYNSMMIMVNGLLGGNTREKPNKIKAMLTPLPKRIKIPVVQLHTLILTKCNNMLNKKQPGCKKCESEAKSDYPVNYTIKLLSLS